MTEVAQTYLGNINKNSDLAELIAIESCLEVYLTPKDSAKGRIHTQTVRGLPIGIIKGRDRALHSGDIFQTESKKLLLIHLQEQELLILDLSNVKADLLPTQLVSLGHILGNHHCPLVIQKDKIYLQLSSNNISLKKTIQDLQIPGLKIYYEMSHFIPTVPSVSHHH